MGYYYRGWPYDKPFFEYKGIIFTNPRYYENKSGKYKVESKFISIIFKGYEIFEFTIKYNDNSQTIKIIRGYKKQYAKKCVFEWYRHKFLIPIIVLIISKELPKKIKKLILLLCSDLITPTIYTDSEDKSKRYTCKVPTIAFNIDGTVYSGYKYIASLFLDSFKWKRKDKTYTIYHPKENKEIEEKIKEILIIFNEKDIQFIKDVRKNLKSIIFTYDITKFAKGTVYRTTIDKENVLIIDLSIDPSKKTILHELLHYTTYSINFIPMLRESFNTLATYLLLPKNQFNKFIKETLLKGEEYEKELIIGTNIYAYSILPIFFYEIIGKNNIDKYFNLFFSDTKEEFIDKLKQIFTKKKFYEEITYLIDYKNTDKNIKSDFLENYTNIKLFADDITRSIFIIYYNKKEFSDNFTKRICYLSSNKVCYTDEKKTIGYTKWIEINKQKYKENIPEQIRKILFFIKNKKIKKLS